MPNQRIKFMTNILENLKIFKATFFCGLLLVFLQIAEIFQSQICKQSVISRTYINAAILAKSIMSNTFWVKHLIGVDKCLPDISKKFGGNLRLLIAFQQQISPVKKKSRNTHFINVHYHTSICCFNLSWNFHGM